VNLDDWDDDELLRELREALRARRAVPPSFVAAAENAFAWRDIDAELAQLTYDSTEGSPLIEVTRTEAASIRALTFTHPRLIIELEISADAVHGQIVPPQIGTIEVQTHAGTGPEISTDEIGYFSIQPIPPGPFRVRCRVAAGIDVLSGWVML
jgi:hypothetical protein